MNETSASKPGTARYTAGTLRYTAAGLALLFFWLAWGVFVYQLMQIVIPSLLPLLLREHGATNGQIAFITTSLNVIGNMIFIPIVSFNSDRCRSRYGRRRPYIVWTTPPVVACLALIPYGPDIAHRLGAMPAIRELLALSPIVPAVLCIAVFVAGFQIFDTFVGSVYFYLIRDTVPERFIGRYLGFSRVIGGIAPLFYNALIFPLADRHMKAIFVGIALVYGVGIYLMCWRVREGEFPPPEPLPGHTTRAWGRLIGAVRLYFRDCFKHPIYWTSFLALGLQTWSGVVISFDVLFQREDLGIPLATVGFIYAIGTAVSMMAALPCGWLVDRFGAFRIAQVTLVARGLLSVLAWFFVRDVLTLGIFSAVNSLPIVGASIAMQKVGVEVWPKEKYGQFGSANSAFASIVSIGMVVLGASFVNAMGNYRSHLIWLGVFSVLSSACFLLLEVQWARRGGRQHYEAP